MAVAGASAATDGVEDDAAEGGGGEGIPEAEVGGGFGCGVVAVTLCHSPATYIAE